MAEIQTYKRKYAKTTEDAVSHASNIDRDTDVFTDDWNFPIPAATDDGKFLQIDYTNHAFVYTPVEVTLPSTGNATTPIYINASGVPTACNAYAGGTAVTLNGTSKAGSTASIYAPTNGGTSGYEMISGGNGAPLWKQPANNLSSSTAAGTTQKTASLANFKLVNGVRVIVKFTYAHTGSTPPTLAIQSTGAKAMYWAGGNRIDKDNSWNDGDRLECIYDGTQWQCMRFKQENAASLSAVNEWTNDNTFLKPLKLGNYDNPAEIDLYFSATTGQQKIISNDNKNLIIQSIFGAGSYYSPDNPANIIIRSEGKLFYVKSQNATPTANDEVATKGDISGGGGGLTFYTHTLNTNIGTVVAISKRSTAYTITELVNDVVWNFQIISMFWNEFDNTSKIIEFYSDNGRDIEITYSYFGHLIEMVNLNTITSDIVEEL